MMTNVMGMSSTLVTGAGVVGAPDEHHPTRSLWIGPPPTYMSRCSHHPAVMAVTRGAQQLLWRHHQLSTHLIWVDEVCVCVCARVKQRICARAWLCACVPVCLCACVSACLRVCVSMRACAHVVFYDNKNPFRVYSSRLGSFRPKHELDDI